MKKLLIINGSPKNKNSNTEIYLEQLRNYLKKENIYFEQINLADYNYDGCIDCGYCRNNFSCSQNDDFTNKLLPLLKEKNFDAFIFASPVYFGGITWKLRAFFDRTVLFRRNNFFFNDKIAGAITIGGSRNGGQELAIIDIIKFALIHGMIVVSDDAPTSHFGSTIWRYANNENGIDELGYNMILNLAKKIIKIVNKL